MSDWLNNPTDIKYCRQCGTPMRTAAAYCPGCGAKQPEQAPAAPVPEAPEAVTLVETPAVEETEPEALVEMPAAQEPAAETPVAETPVAETPAAETPVDETVYEVPQVTPPVPPQPPVQPVQPASEPPRRRKSGALVAVLAVACAALVLGMAVLAAWAISERVNLPTDTSAPSVSQESGTTPSQEESQGNEENSAENSQYNPDAPELIISDSDAEDGGLTTAQIVQNNLDSTVVLDIYDYKTTNSFFGSTNSTLTPVGSATGTIMTEDGYIITNAHCVSDETTGKAYARVDVTLYNGQTYTAEVIAFDHTTDLGVIKIDATGLQKAEFGDSSKLSLGDRVVVLGNGAGLGWSCTQGIVSGFGRPFYEDAGYAIPCIQTDAIINPGNSGGPFLNNMGQVVGITSAKIVAEGYEGLYFVIPINEAKVIIDDLLKYGYVRGRVAIGITGGDTNTEGYEGFMIETIAEDSTLSGSGAKRGDIITAIDGETVKGYADLRTIMAKHQAGDTVTITLRRLEFDRSGRYITNDTTFEVSCVLQESRD